LCKFQQEEVSVASAAAVAGRRGWAAFRRSALWSTGWQEAGRGKVNTTRQGNT
jgi:hypothetical protein